MQNNITYPAFIYPETCPLRRDHTSSERQFDAPDVPRQGERRGRTVVSRIAVSKGTIVPDVRSSPVRAVLVILVLPANENDAARVPAASPAFLAECIGFDSD